MPDKAIRTIGATVVLLGIAVAALVQMGSGGNPSAISLVPEDTTSTLIEPTESDRLETTPTTEPDPFIYRLGVLSGVTTDNFWAFYAGEASVWNAYVLGPTKPALFAPDPSTGALVPELAAAESQPADAGDNWQVVVELNDALHWSDGQPITAHDYVFTFDTVRSLGLGGSWAEAFPDSILSAHADDDHQLRIVFRERPTLAIWPHSAGVAPVMPAHIWEPLIAGLERDGLLALSGSVDVGGGPLALDDFNDDVIVSVANPGYTLASPPDVVEYHVYDDEPEAVAALGVGMVDSVLTPKGLTAEHLASLETDPAVVVAESPANAIRYLGFNLNREPMADGSFRSAVALLLDRESLAGSIPQGGSPALSFISESNTRWFDADKAAAQTQIYQGELGSRLSRAVALLAESGYSWDTPPAVAEDGTVVPGEGLRVSGLEPAPMTILTSGDAYDPARPRYAEKIAETLSWLGFDARPVETDFDTVVDLAFTPGDDGLMHYDMYLLGWTLGNPALPGYYRPLFAPDGVMNNTGYHSPAFVTQLHAYESSYTYEEAREALWSMEATLATELPYLLLYSSEITEVYRNDRVSFGVSTSLGGLQGRLGGITDVQPAS